MLQTYEAILNQGQVQWLDEQPNIDNVRILITVLDDLKPRIKRQAPASISGKAKTVGDIVSPITNEEFLKMESELDDVERDILRMFRLSTPEGKQDILKMGETFIWYNEALRIATEKEIILWDI